MFPVAVAVVQVQDQNKGSLNQSTGEFKTTTISLIY